MAPAKARAATLWTLAVLLSLFFLMSGSGKLANGETPAGDWDAQFVAWGYPAGARWLVGGAEALAAVGLLAPRTRSYAAGALAAIMVGAAATHLANGETFATLFPVVLGALAGTVAWLDRPAWVRQGMGRAQVA